MVAPKLSDIRTSKTKFRPGDRVMCRVSTYLSKDYIRRIERAVNRFVGVPVRLLILDITKVSLFAGGVEISAPGLVGAPAAGKVKFDLSVVDFTQIKRLDAFCKIDNTIKNDIMYGLKEWIGDADVEVVVW